MGAWLDGIETLAAIERLLQLEWDPLVIEDVAEARNAYAGYAIALEGMLRRRVKAPVLAEALMRFERDAMGIKGDQARARRIADQLVALVGTIHA